MRPIVTDVASSVVSVSDCLRLGAEPIEIPLGWVDSRGLKKRCIRLGLRSTREGAILGFLSYPTHFLWSLYFGVCSKRIIESLVATVAANCTALDWSVSHYIVPCEKSSRLRCGLSSKFFDHLLLYHHRLAVFGLLNHLYRLCNDLRMKFNNSK